MSTGPVSRVTSTANVPEDFPPESFALIAFCESCGHQSTLERSRLPSGVTVQDLAKRLRCSRCQARAGTLRIVYVGAGGFRYGEGPVTPIE